MNNSLNIVLHAIYFHMNIRVRIWLKISICINAYIPYMAPTPIIFHLFLSFITIYIITIIESIGLKNVDGDIFVSNVFLNMKLSMSNIGHITISIHSSLSIFIIFFFSICISPIIIFLTVCKRFWSCYYLRFSYT